MMVRGIISAHLHKLAQLELLFAHANGNADIAFGSA
jgi:hypothetical protein